MDADQVRRGIMSTGRRQAFAGLLTGIAAPVLTLSQSGEAKKKRKKCKKCPRVDRCPRRYCCHCDDNSCHLAAANGDPELACSTRCARLGLGWTGWFADPPEGTAFACDQVGVCTVVLCPLV